jgi:hypothetical protein
MLIKEIIVIVERKVDQHIPEHGHVLGRMRQLGSHNLILGILSDVIYYVIKLSILFDTQIQHKHLFVIILI